MKFLYCNSGVTEPAGSDEVTKNPLWALLEAGARLGRQVWRPRKLDLLRKVPMILRGRRYTLIQGIDWTQHERRRTKVRVTYSLDSEQRDPSAVAFLLKCVRAAGHRTFRLSSGTRAVVVRRPIASALELDRSLKRVKAAVTAAYSAGGPPLYGRRTWSARDLDQLLRQILRKGTKEWTPTYVNFRKPSRFSACGFQWDLLHEGLCNEWDKELSFILCSKSKIPYMGWRRLKRIGFFETFASEVARQGYQVSMRVRWGGEYVFGVFSKQIRVRSLEDDVRRHLAWHPAHPFQPHPPDRSSPELFLDGRNRMPKG